MAHVACTMPDKFKKDVTIMFIIKLIGQLLAGVWKRVVRSVHLLSILEQLDLVYRNVPEETQQTIGSDIKRIFSTVWTNPWKSTDLTWDKEICLKMVNKIGWVLCLAPKELREDKDCALEAVRNHGESIMWVSYKLARDKGIVMQAVRQNKNAFSHVPEELQTDMDVLLALDHRWDIRRPNLGPFYSVNFHWIYFCPL